MPSTPQSERAVSERGDAARLGHGVVGDEQRLAHAARHRAGDEEHVGVARRGDDAEPEALQVVVGARELGQLVLAAVAGARIDMTDRETSSASRLRQVDVLAEAAEISEERQHQRSTQA